MAMIRAIGVSVLALLACAPAHADAIYKCVSQGKPASYQNEPCDGGSRLASIREYEPEQVSTSPSPSPVVPRQTPRNAKPRMRTVSAHAARSEVASCQAAKDARDAWERRVGLRRTYEALQVWNDRIRMACK